MRVLSLIVVVTLTTFTVALSAATLSACEPVKLPHETPGPPGCGLRDPSTAGPSTLSVAQQMTLKNQGPPMALEDNVHGGKTWLYVRQAGSVFGEKETAEAFAFDKDGLLKEQTTELRKYTGK
jgi:hypothetical protein